MAYISISSITLQQDNLFFSSLTPLPLRLRDGGNIEFCPPVENLYTSGDEAVPMEGVNDDEAPIHHSDNEAEPMDESYAIQQFYF